MGSVVVIGEPAEVAHYRMAGAEVIEVENADEARRAWSELPCDPALVIMTARAAEQLAKAPPPRGSLRAVIER